MKTINGASVKFDMVDENNDPWDKDGNYSMTFIIYPDKKALLDEPDDEPGSNELFFGLSGAKSVKGD
jgi:hypothetical protein